MEYDNKKLTEILVKHNVKMSDRGSVCLKDFITNVIGSKNPAKYMNKIKYIQKLQIDKIKINKEDYVKPDICVKILSDARFIKCKKMYNEIKINKMIVIEDEDGVSIIDVENNIFQFEGTKFTSFFIKKENDWDVWVKGIEVAKFLEYVDTKQAIKIHIEKENKMSFSNLCDEYESITSEVRIDPQTIFINMSGFMNLIHGSKKKFAQKIKRWIDNEVIPSLIKYGTYTMKSKKLKIEELYDSKMLSSYDKKAVIYVGYIGVHANEHIFKYGLSRDMFRREYNEHRKTFEEFKIIYIEECDNCESVEKLFKKELKIKNLHRELTINNKNQKELFTVTTKYTHETIISQLETLITENKLPALKEKEIENKNLNNVLNTYKQSEELRKLELEYKLSDNYKLECEYKMSKNYKLELENEYKMSKNYILELEHLLSVEREKTKRCRLKREEDNEDEYEDEESEDDE